MSLKLLMYVPAALLSLLPVLAQAGLRADDPDLQEFTLELRKTVRHDDGAKAVMWGPDEYWRATSQFPPEFNPLVKALSPYIVIAVADAKFSQSVGLTFKSASELREEIRIFDVAGKAYTALDEKDLSAEAKAIVDTMRSMFGRAGNADLWANTNFIFFPRKDKQVGPKTA